MSVAPIRPYSADTVVKSVLLFALVGPLVGVVLFLLLFLVGAWQLPADPAGMFIITLVGGYLMGAMPAAIAGLLYAFALYALESRRRTNRLVMWGTGALCGFVACPIWTGFMGGSLEAALSWGLLGAVAGAICAGVLYRAPQHAT